MSAVVAFLPGVAVPNHGAVASAPPRALRLQPVPTVAVARGQRLRSGEDWPTRKTSGAGIWLRAVAAAAASISAAAVARGRALHAWQRRPRRRLGARSQSRSAAAASAAAARGSVTFAEASCTTVALAAASGHRSARGAAPGAARVTANAAAATAEPVAVNAAPRGEDYILGGDVPGNAWELGGRVLMNELNELLLAQTQTDGPFAEQARWFRETFALPEPRRRQKPPPFVRKLKLDVQEVRRRELERGAPETSPFVKAIFVALSWSLDQLYEGRPIQKFWVLETVARIPYFSYVTALHLYESLGWWRTPQIRQIHNAQEDNELHHLLIMESLGGGADLFDRVTAASGVLAYYWIVVALFMSDPALAYNFSTLIEDHAHITYAEFVEANADILREIPPPPIAREYYVGEDMYSFDKIHTSRAVVANVEAAPALRRPPCDNLLDVFRNIRDDELEHLRTLEACQRWWSGNGPSPVPPEEMRSMGRRKDWLEWSARVNAPVQSESSS
eukprot:TRINITY_DN19494_c0_g1_i1.p1 TRINITY_DN19494_c0_g1~~TRINITY_DN19494_c0_g1_i1.p1  ORF type:complete len:505 (-),score=115.30 TRINITY_DN19494_c0_g1_i1:59-1573(-)